MKSIKNLLVVMALFGMPNLMHAQLSNILSKVVSAATTSATTTSTSVEGTWVFAGSAVELESSNLIKKATGSAVSSVAQKKFDAALTKAGITAGKLTFVFKSDGTYTKTIGTNTSTGKYTVSGTTLTMTADATGVASTATVSVSSSSELTMLYNADKVLTGLETVGSKVNDATVSSVVSFMKEYDGMKMGMKFTKKVEETKTTTTSTTSTKKSTTTKKTTSTKKTTTKKTTTKKTTTKKK